MAAEISWKSWKVCILYFSMQTVTLNDALIRKVKKHSSTKAKPKSSTTCLAPSPPSILRMPSPSRSRSRRHSRSKSVSPTSPRRPRATRQPRIDLNDSLVCNGCGSVFTDVYNRQRHERFACNIQVQVKFETHFFSNND